jgi:gliding motility-associated-like protein
MQHFYRLFYVNLLLAVVLLSSVNVSAQTDIKIGTGTTSNSDWEHPSPFTNASHAARTQFLYLASELQAAGMTPGLIHKIRFNVLDLGMYYDVSNSALKNFTIKMGGTTTASLSTTGWETASQVVYSTASYLPVLGINSFDLSSSFLWNGTDNIVVDLCMEQQEEGMIAATRLVEWTTGLPFNGSRTHKADSQGSMCNTSQTGEDGTQRNRPNIIFNWVAVAPCTAAGLNAGNAGTNIPSLCVGEEFKLSVSGQTVAIGLTYQWQSSPDGSAWTNIDKATQSLLQPLTQTASSYYRAVVTCASGGVANTTPVQVLTPTPLSGHFTINNTRPTGSGNFQTFNDAYNSIRCGINGPVVFDVESVNGTYSEALKLKAVPGASAANTITFNGNGNTIENVSTSYNDRAVIQLNDADYFVFNNLNIKTGAGSQFGYGVQLLNNADNNIISNCVITLSATASSDAFAGIVVSRGTIPTDFGEALCDANLFVDNTINGGNYGIISTGSATAPNTNNRILRNRILNFYETGIYIAYSFNTSIDSNIISRPANNSASGNLKGIYVTGLNTRLTVSKNTITNVFGGMSNTSGITFYGINFESAPAASGLEAIVSNNLIYDLRGGRDVYGLYNTASPSVHFFYNTVSIDGAGTGTTSTNFATGIYLSDAIGVRFNNNNIAITRAGQAANTAIHFNTISGDNRSDRNNLYVALGTGARRLGMAAGLAKNFLGDWIAATGTDQNSMSEDPLFTNVATGNLRPTNAALNNAGMPVNVIVDITSAARNITPDIGAFEFTPPVCTSPPIPGKVKLSQAAICNDLPITLSLTGNSSGATQTYQLESAAAIGGPFTAVGTAGTHGTFGIMSATSLYYRIKVSCSGMDTYSDTVLLTVYPPFASNTYTINKNKPASATNFQSFTAAYNAMECGISGPVTFVVEAGSGTYTEQLIWKRIRGVSSINTITFKGSGDTLKNSTTTTGQRATLKLDGASFVNMEGLVIQAAGTTYGYGVQLINNADSNSIKNCVILTNTTATSSTNSTNFAGIVMSSSHSDPAYAYDYTDCDYNLFENNTIIGGYYGITMAGMIGYQARFVMENKIVNNTIRDFFSKGIYLSGTGKALIEGNIITRPTRTSVGAFYGIQVEGISGFLTVRKNRITNPFGGAPTSTQAFYGIYTNELFHIEEEPNYFYNNLIYNIKGGGALNGINFLMTSWSHFNNNTIALDDVSYTGAGIASGFNSAGEQSGKIELLNNMITITRGGNGFKYGFNNQGPLQYLTSDRNDYYIKGLGENNFIGNIEKPRATLQEWTDATIGQDKNSISENPVYADTAAGNFTPTVAPVDNKGLPVTNVTVDILNKIRSTTTPDIGAFEFAVVPCLGNVLAGQAIATPNPTAPPGLCMGTAIALTLNGNTESGYQTYQWQNAPTADGPWYNVGEPVYTKKLQTELFYPYYRCVVSCTGLSVNSDVVQVNRSAPLPAGVYTINSTGGDFASFTAAVNAMQCGIGGAVTFDVAPGDYNEQVNINNIKGATDTSRVTFKAQNGDATSVKLTAAGSSAANYVLRLNSADYVTIKNISVIATSASNGRAIVLAGTVSKDSISGNIITVPVTPATTSARIAVFASPVKGKGIVINNNVVTNGASGIYVAGTTSIPNLSITIQGNTVKGFYQYGVFVQNTDTMMATNNTFTIGSAANTTAYGLYTDAVNDQFQVNANNVAINGNTKTAYGISLNNSTAVAKNGGSVYANKIIALTGNTGSLYGLDVRNCVNPHIVNNVISIKNSGSESYGLYSYANKDGWCYNNSVYSTATASENVAANFSDSYDVKDWTIVKNNIFAHGGGGIALSMENKERFYSDYNMLYTTGSTLIRGVWQQFDNLQDWKTFADQDVNSIVFKPEFTDNNTLKPNITQPGVWAMHGRGTHIDENSYDMENKTRPVTFEEGVPDLGAYEFEPTSVPVACVAQPATPVAGGTQIFMLGSDTVSVVKWGSTAPSAVTLRRYSGAVPPNLAPDTKHMYFYVQTELTGSADGYTIDQHYIDPWRGFIDRESRIRLGRTDAAAAWTTGITSTVNDVTNIISQSGVNYMGQFTGLTDAKVSYPPAETTALFDSTHMGTRFWVAYGHSNAIGPFSLNMGGSAKDADVTVRINGTQWERHYHIPANTFLATEEIPREGVSGAHLRSEGWSERAIGIESTEPITVYARGDEKTFTYYSVGATLVLPVGTYGYEYYALAAPQRKALPWDPDGYSWFNVIADHDGTEVEITPTNPTQGGHPAGVPFTVMLNRGEVYQVLGASITGEWAYDLSGSKVRSLGTAGKCYPVAVFSGNSSGVVDCKLDEAYSYSYLIQQNYPVTAWGKNFVTAPLPRRSGDLYLPGPTGVQKNMYRIAVSDPSTVVKVNGSALSGLNRNFYEYWSDKAERIEADKPVMVAQYIPNLSLVCNEELGGNTPEVFYLVPVEYGVKKSVFYRTDQSIEGAAAEVYLTLVIPTAGVSSLRIDGSATFDHSYAHPNKAGYTVVIKRWSGEKATSTVQSDSAFTGIVYGNGGTKTYGYTLGLHIPNMARPGFVNRYDSTGNFSTFNCLGTPFQNSILLPIQASSITWKFSAVTNVTPATDVTVLNPVPVATVVLHGSTYYKYELKADYNFSVTGDYVIPVEYAHSSISNCSGTLQTVALVKVVDKPEAVVNITYSGCSNDAAQLSTVVTPTNGDLAEKYKWDMGDATTASIPAPSKQWNTAGGYTVKLDVLTKAGCIAKAEKLVTVKDVAVFGFVNNVTNGCTGSDVTLAVKDPETGVTYNWYEALTGGSAVHTGPSYTLVSISAAKTYYVEATLNGCTSRPRQQVTASPWPVITNPVARVDSVAVDLVRFAWNAVPGVSDYQVSTDGGNTWITPSSGASGLTHTITGLPAGKEVRLKVKAVHPNACTDGISEEVITHTLPSEVFIPNAFSPNGDNKNEVFKVGGFVIRSMQLMIFNQWGEKVFESADQAIGWDGRYKGQQQPSGVYIYVCNIVLTDGSRVVKKGSVNLVR